MSKAAAKLTGALASALIASAAHAAPSIAGDAFGLTVEIDDGIGGVVTVTDDSFTLLPFAGVAAAVADNTFSNPDMLALFSVDGTDYEFRFNWIDADSFDFQFLGFGAVDLGHLKVTLTGLDFKDGAQAVDISDAAFRRGQSDVDTYDAGPGMPDPAMSFTTRSVTAQFSFIPGGLMADAPVLRFDVQTGVVPEPATWALWLAGVAGVGAVARRRARG
jgi:hypothetical protein